MPNQVRARDVAPDSARRIDSAALRAVKRGRMSDLLGDHFVFQALLAVVNVVDKFVESVDALLEATLDPIPLLGADDPGNQIEGENPLCACGISINIKGNAHLEEERVGRSLVPQKFALFQRFNGFKQQTSLRPGPAFGVEHFVIKSIRLIRVELHSHLPAADKAAEKRL